MKFQASLFTFALMLNSASAVNSQNSHVTQLGQAKASSRVKAHSQAKLKASSKAKAKTQVKTQVKTQAKTKNMSLAKAQASAGGPWPRNLAIGGTWDSGTERDCMYRAYCRCVSEDLTKGLSICASGCGDPSAECTPDFGCTHDERSCNANQCTCMPQMSLYDYSDLEWPNTMTYAQCYDQCDAIGMKIIGTEEEMWAAKNTGCNANGRQTWMDVVGAYQTCNGNYADCTNDDSVVDSYDDTCSEWYNENPETCGDYDTDVFTASESCCACKWDAMTTDAVEFDPEDWDEVIKANFAVIFTKDECVYCHHSINYLSSLGYSSYVIDLDLLSNRPEVVNSLQDHIGNSMVPAIFIYDQYIGGYTQLQEKEESGDLEMAFGLWNNHETECQNDDSVEDAGGDTCSMYYSGDVVPDMCGEWDTENFHAATMCCNCM